MNTEDKIRTDQQRKALEVFFTELAETLNNGGLDIQTVLAQSVSRPWSPRDVKDLLWRNIQRAMTGKESTTQLTTKEIDGIYDVLNRHLGEKFNVHVPFPNQDEKYYKQIIH